MGFNSAFKGFLLDNSSVFYIHLFDVRLPEDDVENIELRQSISGM